MKKTDAFLCYSRLDDSNDNDWITWFREQVESEVLAPSGRKIHIFQDLNDIDWGDLYKKKISAVLNIVKLFIPVITPNFFLREACREELKIFLQKEKELGRDDLVLPLIYKKKWMDVPSADPEINELKDKIRDRHYIDITNVSKQKKDIRVIRKILSLIAKHIQTVLQRIDSGNPGRSNYNNNDIIVDIPPFGDFISISEAIANAKSGSRIFIRPKTYKETIIIEKSIELIGDTDDHKNMIIIEGGKESVIHFRAEKGKISNIVLRQLDNTNYCIIMEKGKLELQNCDISSQSTGIKIHNEADPVIKHNHIHDCSFSGIEFENKGKGVIENNFIYNNYDGIQISQESKPNISNNEIYSNKNCGILVHYKGNGKIVNNRVYENGIAGIGIKSGSNPEIIKNHIYKNQEYGIAVLKRGKGDIQYNDIFENKTANIFIKSSGDPHIHNENQIHDGEECGLLITDKGKGIIEGNEIYGNNSSNIEISDKGDPEIYDNLIYEGNAVGILITGKGLGNIKGNKIHNNYYSNIRISDESDPVITDNMISKSNEYGIFISDKGKGMLINNTFEENNSGDIFIETSSDFVICPKDRCEKDKLKKRKLKINAK